MRGTRSIGWGSLLGLGLLVLAALPAESVPTTEFTVTGDIVASASYTLSTLQPLPATTETVTFQTGSGPQTGTFTGRAEDPCGKEWCAAAVCRRT